MSTGPALWFIMTVGGAILLGMALVYGLISTRRRRENPLAQRLTDTATRSVYREEEAKRVREEETGALHTERPDITVTEARQGVTGHNVHVVLGWSLTFAIIAGAALVWYFRL